MNRDVAQMILQKHKVDMIAAMSHSDNPYHAQHIKEFYAYTDASVKAMGSSLMEALPSMIRSELAKKEVEIKVDEKSYQATKKKINELM